MKKGYPMKALLRPILLKCWQKKTVEVLPASLPGHSAWSCPYSQGVKVFHFFLYCNFFFNLNLSPCISYYFLFTLCAESTRPAIRLRYHYVALTFVTKSPRSPNLISWWTPERTLGTFCSFSFSRKTHPSYNDHGNPLFLSMQIVVCFLFEER